MMRFPAGCLGLFLILVSPLGPALAGSQEIAPRCREIVSAASADDHNFHLSAETVARAAWSADLLATPDGPWLYWTDAEGLRLTTPDGQSFRPLLDQALAPDAAEPDLVRQPDGSLRLFHRQGDSIRVSVSKDGKSFDSLGVALAGGWRHPSVVRLPNGRWLMAAAKPDGGAVALFTSPDGLAFQPTGQEMALDTAELELRADGRLRLLHGVRNGLASLVSTDQGKNWKPEPGLRLRSKRPMWEPAVAALPHGGWVLLLTQETPGCRDR